MGFADHDLKLLGSFRTFVERIDFLKRRLKLSGRVFKERSARTLTASRTAKGAGRHDGLVSITFQSNQPECHVQQTASVFLDLERVFAAQVNGARRRCIHYEYPWWRPCLRFNLSAVERDAVLV